MAEDKKRCAVCGKEKELRDFPRHGRSFDGHARVCAQCKAQRKDRRYSSLVDGEVEDMVRDLVEAVEECRQLGLKIKDKLGLV